MRGLKRKFGVSNSTSGDSEEKLEYRQNLSDFQTAARQRESIRLKNHCLLPNSTPGLWEKHLTEKVHVETQMIKGTGKFLTACKNQEQALEAAKRLQLSRLRLDMLKYELNKLKRGRGSPAPSNGPGAKFKPSYAGVSISDIRIPLMWKRKDHMKDVGDGRRFAVFCLARIGAQIYDSAMMCPIDRSHTDINLTDVFLFNKISAHFEVTIEVYAKLLTSGNSTTSLVKEAEAILGKTPQRICRSISRAVGKKILSANEAKSARLEGADVGPKFELIASTTLSLDDCSRDVETYELYVVDANSEQCPPLFGALCCRIAAMPYCCEDPVMSGSLKVRGDDASQKFREMFASLMDWKLSLWSSESQKDSARRPALQIKIDRDTCILERGNDEVSLTNVNHETGSSITWSLVFEDDGKENQQAWLMTLMQHAADHRRWKKAAETKMHLGSMAEVEAMDSKPKKRPRYTKSFKRTRSKLFLLYNQAGQDDQDGLI